MLVFTALVLLLVALPDLLRGRGSPPRPWSPWASTVPVVEPPPPDPALRPLALLQQGLLERLQEADQAWIPRVEALPDGGTRYVYRRRAGDPELSLPQIRALIADPPRFEEERRSIVALLTQLERVGAAVALTEPIKLGAAAEWDPRARTLRLRPDVPDQGSLQLARVLNHEAIHVAQSCANGGVAANPRPLGLIDGAPVEPSGSAGGALPNSGRAEPIESLRDPLYADLSPQERRMEEEAYTLQNRLEVGVRLLRLHCLGGGAGSGAGTVGVRATGDGSRGESSS